MNVVSARSAQYLGRWVTARGLGKLALLTAAVTVGLVTYGAWVRASGSGLGCPDWPLCNGAILPTNRAAAIESGHRWFAALTMALVFGTTVLALARRKQYPNAFLGFAAASGLIVAQAILGAIVVLTEIDAVALMGHLVLAMGVIVFMTIGGMALIHHKDASFNLRRPGWALPLGAAGAIMLGGSIIATHTSFECPGIPVCDSSSPAMATTLHVAHRTLGVIVLLGAAFLGVSQWRKGETGLFFRINTSVVLLLIAQVTVGVTAVFLELPGPLRILHLGLASLIWWGVVAMWSLSAPVDEMAAAR